jgi:hypothetical protein
MSQKSSPTFFRMSSSLVRFFFSGSGALSLAQ